MKEEKSLRLFSDETLDSMTMAMFCGGEAPNNCHGATCNTVAVCGCTVSLDAANVGVVCFSCTEITIPNKK